MKHQLCCLHCVTKLYSIILANRMLVINLKIVVKKYVIVIVAEPGGRAVYGVSLRSLDCWDRVFESHCGHECSSVVFVCCVGSCFCDGLMTLFRGVSVCFCVFLIVCDLETSIGGLGCSATEQKRHSKKRQLNS
jgi:hypothetical protein